MLRMAEFKTKAELGAIPPYSTVAPNSAIPDTWTTLMTLNIS
jgi:hypothetical protein